MLPDAGGGGGFEIGKIPRKKRVDRGRIKGGQRKRGEDRALPDCIGRLRGQQAAFGFLDLGVYAGIFGEAAKGIDRERAALRGGDRVPFHPESPVVFLDPGDMPLQRRVESDALRAQNQLVEVLPVRCLDCDARADVLGHKDIVEHGDPGQRGRPCAVLKHERCAGEGKNDMRGVRRAEALPFIDKRRLARVQRAQDGGECRLAPPVFGIDQ